MNRKRSEVWLHFSVVSSEKAKCDICKNVFSYKGGATSNLQKHLKSKHISVLCPADTLPSPSIKSRTSVVIEPVAGSSSAPDYIPDNQEENKDSEEIISHQVAQIPPKPKQTKISSFSVRPASISRTKHLNEKVLDMIIRDLQPFSVVEDAGFKDLVAALDPSYQVPSRTTFSRNLLIQKFEDATMKIKLLLKEAEIATLTTDTWTSRAVENYMALTVHYLDKEWNMKSILLGCLHFKEQHTSENIRNELLNILRNWELSEKIHAVVTDNARNITGAIKLTGWPHLPCLAHTLNLVVQDALKLIHPIQCKAKKIVEHFHRSTTAATKLTDMQSQMNRNVLKLINDVVTRWNSTYNMFQRLCEVQVPLEATLGVLHNPVEILNESDWITLKSCCALLKPFEQVTKELSAEKNVCVSKIIPLIEGLKLFISGIEPSGDDALALKNSLLTGLQNRFSRLEYNSLLAKATFLDPRFKQKGFSDSNAITKVRDGLQSEMSALFEKSRLEEMETKSQEQDINTTTDDIEVDSIWQSFDAKISKTTSTVAASIIECRQYSEEANINRKGDPLKWWKTREPVYPYLSRLARKYLCAVATSVPSERVFSKAGLIISDRRSRLKPKNAEKIIFLNANFEFL